MRAFLLPALLALASGAAQAQHTVKTLAQFDLGYAKCEARFPHMKGHGDDAFLALWKTRPEAQQRAHLAQLRKSASYQEERRKAQAAMAPPSPEIDTKIRRQCQATWRELQSRKAHRAPAAASAASASKK